MEGPMEKDVEEVDAEMDMGEAPSTRNLAPEQALVPLATMLVIAGIWAGGQGNQLAKPAISLRARGNAPAIQAE